MSGSAITRSVTARSIGFTAQQNAYLNKCKGRGSDYAKTVRIALDLLMQLDKKRDQKYETLLVESGERQREIGELDELLP